MASGGADIAPLEVKGPHPDQADQDQITRLKSMDRVIHDAKMATDKEHNMTLWEGVKLYPKAIGWSVLISTCIVMVTLPSQHRSNKTKNNPQLTWQFLNERKATTSASWAASTPFRSSTGSTASSFPMATGRSPRVGKLGSVM